MSINELLDDAGVDGFGFLPFTGFILQLKLRNEKQTLIAEFLISK